MGPQPSCGALETGTDFEQPEPDGSHPSVRQLSSPQGMTTKQSHQLIRQCMQLQRNVAKQRNTDIYVYDGSPEWASWMRMLERADSTHAS